MQNQRDQLTSYYDTKHKVQIEGKGLKRILSPQSEIYETVQLQEGATYQFWVRESTRVGEGESTRVVTIAPSNKVPARIVSFSREIVTTWKKDITLPCRKVGIPVPQAVWRLQDRIMETNGRKQACC